MSSYRSRSWSWYARYRGQTGQWAHLLHRLAGLGLVAFLILHVLDTSLVAWGPGTYNAVIGLYHNNVVRLFEVALVGVVIYHALNGVRVTILDFWPRGTLYQERIFWMTMALLVVLFLSAAYMMLSTS